jgi:lipopolysaccharide transport system ATP-binding protein
MGELAVRVEGLSKEYRLGGSRERYATLRDRVNKLASAPFRGLRSRGERSEQNPRFWALKDVSFEVRPGEVVGIIGRNGAGKSTLLKILSRITEPTEGEVDINGRVGSLLEVGTGFHPELSGRENVYLNGAILGMRRTEITRKFDEIVAFAEVEKFIDTPVKHYSSGMYMRLAFAVAAHLEPEILIVDEVLAVGDAEFQKKCLGKMGDAAKGGRTVLFVSHNMSAVQSLCSRAIVLRAGRAAFDGATAEVMPVYLDQPENLQAEWHDDRTGAAKPTGDVRLVGVRVRRADGPVVGRLAAFEPFEIEIDYSVSRPTLCQIAFRVNKDDGETVFTTGDGDQGNTFCRSRLPGRCRARVRIPGHLLPPGRYHLLVAANRPSETAHDLLEKVLHFEVDSVGSLRKIDGRFGAVVPLLDWTDVINIDGKDH